ncbi:MAG: NAD(P)H-dependent oxidoreductase [Candidatus Paceibacterota bacterium]
MKTITEALMWRYATKQFDATKIVPEETIHQILEAGRLSPSSFGLQPWKFILVENKDLRLKLKEAAYNQPQVIDASHMLVLAYKNTVDEAYIDTYMQSVAEARSISVEDLAGFKGAIMGSIAGKPSDALAVWNSRQVYLPLGIMLEAAALLEVDACPMEGFDTAKFNEILGLNEIGYSSVAMMTIGYRADTDTTAGAAKSRFPLGEVVIRK